MKSNCIFALQTQNIMSLSKAQELKLSIETFGINSIGVTDSVTDYGNSSYLTFYHNDNLIKIRISDHDATNSVRVEKEIMFKNDASIEKMTFTIEQILFPERFSFIPCTNGQKPTHIKNGTKCVIIRN